MLYMVLHSVKGEREKEIKLLVEQDTPGHALDPA